MSWCLYAIALPATLSAFCRCSFLGQTEQCQLAVATASWPSGELLKSTLAKCKTNGTTQATTTTNNRYKTEQSKRKGSHAEQIKVEQSGRDSGAYFWQEREINYARQKKGLPQDKDIQGLPEAPRGRGSGSHTRCGVSCRNGSIKWVATPASLSALASSSAFQDYVKFSGDTDTWQRFSHNGAIIARDSLPRG